MLCCCAGDVEGGVVCTVRKSGRDWVSQRADSSSFSLKTHTHIQWQGHTNCLLGYCSLSLGVCVCVSLYNLTSRLDDIFFFFFPNAGSIWTNVVSFWICFSFPEGFRWGGKKKEKKQLHWFESQVSESNRVTSSSRVWALKFVFASEKAIWSVTMKTKIVNQIFIIVLAILASG
jgi:hypothetical protein